MMMRATLLHLRTILVGCISRYCNFISNIVLYKKGCIVYRRVEYYGK